MDLFGKKYVSRLVLTACLAVLSAASAWADETAERVEALQKRMYELFNQPEAQLFFEVTDELKSLSEERHDEKTYYKAWGNQVLYESLHNRRTRAVEIAKEMRQYAIEHNSIFGQQTALHVMGSVNYRMRNFAEAEQNFLESIELIHQHFPGESAAAAYLELSMMAGVRGNENEAGDFARQALDEPNVSPQHMLRALTQLCQIDYSQGKREDFNRHYQQRSEMKKLTPVDQLDKEIDVLYFTINNDYERALAEAAHVTSHRRYQMLARIYHKMGNDAEAYQAMLRYTQANDSANAVKQDGLLSDYISQLTNERLESEKLELEKRIQRQNELYRYSFIALLVGLLSYAGYRRYRRLHERNSELNERNSALNEQNTALDQAQRAEHEAREKAEKALDVKREFLNNISHELRMPLNPITGFSDILATPDFELQAEEREAMSRHIKDSSKVLTRLIDNMIELSFYESKTSLPKEDIIAPNIVGLSTVDDLLPKVNEGVELHFTTELTNAVTLKTDLQSLQKVVYHLVDNAIKYTRKGSIDLHCRQDGDRIEFSVTDTGIGIPPERQDNVFDMFVKNGDNMQATGMGLNICSSIVHLLGGDIWLDKNYHDGCRFVFNVPME